MPQNQLLTSGRMCSHDQNKQRVLKTRCSASKWCKAFTPYQVNPQTGQTGEYVRHSIAIICNMQVPLFYTTLFMHIFGVVSGPWAQWPLLVHILHSTTQHNHFGMPGGGVSFGSGKLQLYNKTKSTDFILKHNVVVWKAPVLGVFVYGHHRSQLLGVE